MGKQQAFVRKASHRKTLLDLFQAFAILFTVWVLKWGEICVHFSTFGKVRIPGVKDLQ